jgi:hypothetical protein
MAVFGRPFSLIEGQCFRFIQETSAHSTAFAALTEVNTFNNSVQYHIVDLDFVTHVCISNGLVFYQLTWFSLLFVVVLFSGRAV